jgi:hypothetical protein
MQVYRYYLMLDSDRNGLLSKAELLQYGRPVQYTGGREGGVHDDGDGGEGDGVGGQPFGAGLLLPVPSCALTSVFIDRVFEECCQLYGSRATFASAKAPVMFWSPKFDWLLFGLQVRRRYGLQDVRRLHARDDIQGPA